MYKQLVATLSGEHLGDRVLSISHSKKLCGVLGVDLNNGDFWRFTPSGLARLHKDYSEVFVADGWGNPLMPLVGLLGLTHMSVPEARWHPFNMLARANRTSYAFVVWVVARK
jgi:hypothetical protein